MGTCREHTKLDTLKMVGGGGNHGFAFLPSLQLLQRFSTLGRHKAPFTSDVQYVVLPSHIVPATRDNYQKCVNDHDSGVKSESIRIRTYLYTPAGTPPKIHKYGEKLMYLNWDKLQVWKNNYNYNCFFSSGKASSGDGPQFDDFFLIVSSLKKRHVDSLCLAKLR